MGLFSFFNRDRSGKTVLNNRRIDIPREIFIEDGEPKDQNGILHSNGKINGIEAIYGFLQDDYESKGYNDALVNPDDSYKADNIRLIKLDLQILVQKVTTYYEDSIKVLDFHISSRGRAGLIDLVEELKIQKDMVIEHMEKVNRIKQEMESEDGMAQRMIFSYQRGFMRGLSAITQSKVLGHNL